MPWNLLLLPLLGGYYYCTRCESAKYKYRKHDGNRLLLASALHAIAALAVVSVLLTLLGPWLFHRVPVLQSAYGWWQARSAFPHLGKALAAFLLCVGYSHLLNRFVDPEEQRRKVIQSEGDSLEELLLYAFDAAKPMLISLRNNKVYLCMMTEGTHPILERRHIQVLPLRSGYRNKETLQLQFTTDYVAVFDRLEQEQHAAGNDADLELDDFVLTIDMKDIMTATIFDVSKYDSRPQAKGDSTSLNKAPAADRES